MYNNKWRWKIADWKDILSRAYNQDGGNKNEKNNIDRITKFFNEVINPAFEEMLKQIKILEKDIPLQIRGFVTSGLINSPSLTCKLNNDLEWSFHINYGEQGQNIYVTYVFKYKDTEPIDKPFISEHIDRIDKDEILCTIAELIEKSRGPSLGFGGIHV